MGCLWGCLLRWLFAFLLFCFLVSPAFAADKDPDEVVVGAYVNDVQEIDLHTDSYRMDLYVWFRWKNPEIDPSHTSEFMNSFSPSEHVRTFIYDKPQKMPDGSLYNVIREQGQFSAKFPLQQYPFDRQELVVAMENTVHPVDELVYVPDIRTPIPLTLSKRIQLPGYTIARPEMRVENFPYPTNFGDISNPALLGYSRAVFAIPISRPVLSTCIKIFMPVLLVMLCTSLVFFVHPAYIEGRLGVVITALLTLVALQLTSSSALPDVEYLLMTDKVYLLSYIFIIATMLQVVRLSNRVQAQKFDEVKTADNDALALCGLVLVAGIACIFWTTF